MIEPLYTIDDVMKRYSVSKDTVYDWTCRRKISFIKVGKLLRFRESDLKDFEKRGHKSVISRAI